MFFSTLLPAFSLSVSREQVDKILETLDREITVRDEYIGQRQARIDSIRRSLGRDHDRRWIETTLLLGDAYNSFNNDSALFVYSRGYDRAVALGEDSLATLFRLRRATILPLAGFNEDARREFEAVNPALLSPDLKIQYYSAGRQMYSYMASYFASYPESRDYFNRLALEAQGELLKLLDEDSNTYLLNQGEYFYYTREYPKAKATLRELLDRLPESSNQYARASHIISEISKARGEHNDYVYYLALSAVADVKSATLEVVALQELGQMMYNLDDIDRAHVYLSTALQNAVDCHASMRVIQTAEALPIIESSHLHQQEQSRKHLVITMWVMVFLVIGLVGALVYLFYDKFKMHRLQRHLEAANHTKDVYISQFLNLCSIYMDKLNQFCKIANRKITTGKVDDLYKITKSGKFVEENSKEFYETFDNAFLHLYPTFVADVNRLLRPDQQIVLAKGEKMNTDLRILAFMRLGIDESQRIAQVLNYSVYTIYTYRNKLKNRAIDRDRFEQDVLKINS